MGEGYLYTLYTLDVLSSGVYGYLKCVASANAPSVKMLPVDTACWRYRHTPITWTESFGGPSSPSRRLLIR
jgi:hypothetical protein